MNITTQCCLQRDRSALAMEKPLFLGSELQRSREPLPKLRSITHMHLLTQVLLYSSHILMETQAQSSHPTLPKKPISPQG